MTTCCPDCYAPVSAKPGAREGRCDDCRPRRQHSKPRHVSAGERYWNLVAENQDHR